MEEQMLLTVLTNLFTGPALLYILAGALIGVIFGATPGVGPDTAIAILITVSFGMEPLYAILFLGAIWTGGIFGGSWCAILVNVPGTPLSVATAFDGFPMSKQGRALEALGAATLSSFFGGVAGVIMLMTLAPILIGYIVKIGAPEYLWISVLALVVVAVLNKTELLKGLISCLLGLSLGLVGLDLVLGVPRYTAGTLYLLDGIKIIPLMVGLFGVGEAIRMLQRGGVIATTGELSGNLVTGFLSVLRNVKAVIVSAVIGLIVGILPGIGGSAANLLAYSEVRRRSKDPETFGKGNVRGVIAAETANNAIQGGALIPTLTLGIPGSVSSALLLSSMMIHGIFPGRMLFEQNADYLWSFFGGLIIAQFIVLFITLVLMRWLSLVTIIPNELLGITVLCLSFIGLYSINRSIYDIVIAVAAGFFAYYFRNAGYPLIGLIVGIILGKGIERTFHQALQISGGDYSIFFVRPISIAIILTIVFLVTMEYRKEIAGIFRRGGKGKTA